MYRIENSERTKLPSQISVVGSLSTTPRPIHTNETQQKCAHKHTQFFFFFLDKTIYLHETFRLSYLG